MTNFKIKRIFKVFLVLIITGITINYLFEKAQAEINFLKEPIESLLKMDLYKKLKPEKIHSKIDLDIVEKLLQLHYNSEEIDDEMSKNTFEKYFSELDGTKSYFLAKDVKSFEKYKYKLDDFLMDGNLMPAFEMFNAYQKKVIERIKKVLYQLNSKSFKVNFDIEESIETDREKAPWAKNIAELDELWRKRIKNEILNLKLTGKKMDEIIELLIKRYKNQLHRAYQTNDEDAFRFYMNVVTQLYDPHTQYFSPRVSENFNIQMSLSLEGIGAVLQREDEYTKVVRLVPAGPADKAGELQPGDLIVGVGQGLDEEIVDVIGWRLDDVVQLIRGPKGTIVRLMLIPNDENDKEKRKTIKITRDKVKLEEQAAQKKILKVEYNNKTYKVGVINIPTFYLDFKALYSGKPDYRSTTRDVRKLVNEIIKENVEGIIIDLRDNGGGALQEANSLTGLFIKKGPVVQVRSADGRITRYMDQDPEIVYNGPLVIVVNRLSASASEIFSGAIQDYNRGIILGTQTFGKGTVQSLLDLNQGQLKLTHAKFYRVSGKSTQYKGIIPDISFPSIINIEKIGENTLPNALEYDHINKANFSPHHDLSSILKVLDKKHKQRIKNDCEFIFLSNTIKYKKEKRLKTKFSLKESTREKERLLDEKKQIELENTRRIAKGLKPVKTFDELKKENKDDDTNDETKNNTKDDKKDDDTDPFLNESAQILLDYISLLSTDEFAHLSEEVK